MKLSQKERSFTADPSYSKSEPESLGRHHFIDQIVSYDQWLGREHILDFHKRYAPDFDKKTPSQVFNVLVAPAMRARKGRQGNHRLISADEVTPFTGLVVKTRENLGIEPLEPLYFSPSSPKETIKRVVKVESMFTFYANLSQDPQFAESLHGMHNPQSAKRRFFYSLISHLSENMIDGNLTESG